MRCKMLFFAEIQVLNCSPLGTGENTCPANWDCSAWLDRVHTIFTPCPKKKGQYICSWDLGKIIQCCCPALLGPCGTSPRLYNMLTCPTYWNQNCFDKYHASMQGCEALHTGAGFMLAGIMQEMQNNALHVGAGVKPWIYKKKSPPPN